MTANEIPAGHSLYRDPQGRLWVVADAPMPIPSHWTEAEDIAAWTANPFHSGRRLIAKTGRISKNDYRIRPSKLERVR